MSNGDLWEQTQAEYPLLRQSGIVYQATPRTGGSHLETWPPQETGTKEAPRPQSIPLDKYGIEVYDPKATTSMVMGDALSHVLRFTDPKIKGYYQQFVQSLTPQQLNQIAGDYHPGEGDYQQWLERVGKPSFFRGYPTGQWPAQQYTQQQRALLDQMMQYLRSAPGPK